MCKMAHGQAPSLSSSVGLMDSMVSMLRDIKSGADHDSPNGPLRADHDSPHGQDGSLRADHDSPDGPLRDDDLNTTFNSAANLQSEPDAALNAASPEPQASEGSLHSAASPLHAGPSVGRVPLGPVLQQGGQRVGEIPRQQQLSSRGNNGRMLVGDRVDGTWEVRAPEAAASRSRTSNKSREQNTSQQSWSVSKSATPTGVKRPVHIVHRHHHHHYHHHYFPGEGDEIPASAFAEGSTQEVASIQHSKEQGGRFAPSSSLSATPPAAHDSSEHRHFHYHHHAQSLGIPGHAQKLLDASDQKQLEAENARGTSPIPLSGNRGVDVDGTEHAIYNMPGTRLPSLI